MSIPPEDHHSAVITRHSDAGRMGKAVEHLVAASCIITSRAELNVSTSLVDDEGVDLVFFRRGGTTTLAVQVKSRMTDASPLPRGRYQAAVRHQTFRSRRDLYMLFVAVDQSSATITVCWWIPSEEFERIAHQRGARLRWSFVAAMSRTANDQWSSYRVDWGELPTRILSALGAPKASAGGTGPL